MGFGANLFLIFIFLPLSGLLLLIWLLSKKLIFGKILGLMWLGAIGLLVFSVIAQKLKSPVILEKQDYYSEYIIKREYYPGKQADWQYENFRFEIKDNDSIYFYVTDKQNVSKTYRGNITTTKTYISERLIINMEQPTHHILSTNPTVYRNTKSFYLVFNSPEFYNVYFKKGKWKPLKP